MPTHVLCIRRLAKILAGATLLAAALVPTASAHVEQPMQALDAFHPLGLPAADPWLASGQQLESDAATAAFRKLKAGAIVGTADTKVECIGNGTMGKRVQLLYVHDADAPDNYAADKASIGQWAVGADRIYRESAAKTSGPQRIRFVTDAYCNLSILDVTVDDDPNDLNLPLNKMGPIEGLVQAQGFNAPDRKYVMFIDNAQAVCGVGDEILDDQPGAANASNGGTAEYTRIDFTKVGCTNPPDWVMAHELTHNLGGVQQSAPHNDSVPGTFHGHCTDDYDRVCQDDGTGLLTVVCPDYANEALLDCNNDDYFNANPPAGSYLDTNWNVARSDFLESDPASQWGFVKANDPTNASYTPSGDYNQSSTNQKNTTVRTGTGSYKVTFTDLANFGGEAGTTLVTSLGTMGEHCNDSAWSSYGTPDTTVTVHCWSAAGALVDSQFTAAYIRPTSSPGDFAYLWLDDETTSAVGYTPSLFHQFNSSGGVNTTTRNAVGDYTVRLAGMSSDGGTVKVTGFSGGANYCKPEWWSPSGADELVEVRCFGAAGAPVNSKFTLVWADSQSILSNGASNAYVYSTNATPAAGGYTPPAATNYNSSGALNTVVRNGLGQYTVTVPNLGSQPGPALPLDRGTVHVTATMATSKRCEVSGWSSPITPPGAATPVLVDVTCTTPAGALTDSKFVLQFSK